MFTLKANNNFKAKVTVLTPYEDQVVEWTFTGEFKILNQEDAKKKEFDLPREALVGATDLPKLDDGVTEEQALEILLTRPDTRAAITKTYREQVVKKNQPSSFG